MVTKEKKCSILIAENDQDLLNCLRRYFKDNYRVTTFFQREDIIRHAPSAHFLLLESRLVMIYGFNFLEQIIKAAEDIAIIIMGDIRPGSEEERSILTNTVTKVLSKPFEPKEIESIIGDCS
ncbi:response regulator [candidate division KSB1 bacterium]